MSTSIGVWVAALLTLAMFSFLYRENPIYRVAEHILVGVASAYTALLMFYRVFIPFVWKGILHPNSAGSLFWTLLFTVLALLFLAPFVPRYGWLARIPAAIAVGYAAGQELIAAVQAKLYPQLLDTVTVFGGAGSFIDAVLILVGTLSVVFYFTMTFRRNPVMNGVSRVGVIFLMVGFGAIYGNMVISRFTLLIGRIEFLFGEWIHLIPS